MTTKVITLAKARMHEILKENRDRVKAIKLLPNVSEFKVVSTGVHLTAMLYGITKIIHQIYVKKLSKGEYNDYLARQLKRLSFYAITGQREKFLYLAKILMTRSESFRLKFMNEVDRKWFLRKPWAVDSRWRRLSKLCESQSQNLNFKRVWITDPGKSERYTRPLGVPTPEWRAYSRMKLEIMERWFKGQGLLQPWQHGGRSKSGLLSAYKEILPKYEQYKTIIEFDIKGFFNNLSHDKITSLFEKYFDKKIIKGLLNINPSKYEMPPLDEDKAVQALEQLRPIDWFEDDFGPTTPEELEIHLGYEENPDKYAYDRGLREDITWRDIIDEEDLQIMRNIPKINLREDYKGIMEGEKIYLERIPIEGFQLNVLPYTNEDLALGRDKWKGLGQEGKGVPQGLGTSPFCATLMTDFYLKPVANSVDGKGLTMYMDDGLLFTNSKSPDGILNLLKASLSKIGLEIEPKKTKVVKQAGRWLNTIKFLGMRYDGVSKKLSSDTRAGTKRNLPELISIEEFLTKFENLKPEDWKSLQLEHYGRLKDVDDRSWKTGLKNGFLGTLISEAQYKGAKSAYLRQLEIAIGSKKAQDELIKADWSIVSRNLLDRERTLTNASSIACAEFLLIKRSGLTVKTYSRIKHQHRRWL